MDNDIKLKKIIYNLLIIVIILIILYYASQYNFLLFHILSELFSIVIAFVIYIIAWNSKKYINNHYFLFIGISFLFIGIVDLIQTLSYKGMNIISGYDADLPTQLWIIARYMESIALISAPIFIHRKLNVNIVSLTFAIITILLLFLSFYKIFPASYVEGYGLTHFKKISEYIISLIMIMSIVLLLINKNYFDKKILYLLIFSIISTIISEISFTLYINVYGPPNIVGHYFKIIAFILFYHAIIQTSIENPFQLIFRELKKKEERLSILAATDDLTGLYNRRACYEHLQKMIAFTKRYNSCFSVCLIDLDYLKEVNDNYGHSEGDELLRTFADTLKKYTRESDYICRIGGDEFLLIFTNCNKIDAEKYISRINEGIDLLNAKNTKYQISFSYGLSEFDNTENYNIDKIIEIADRNMYKDKLIKTRTSR